MPRDAIITTDVGWNKNGVGQQFPIYTPGQRVDTRRLRNHGLRSAGGHRRQDRRAGPRWCRWSATAASARTRRCSRPRVEDDLAVIWVVMNNNAFGTIAGLQRRITA